jgi:hypothetical protein
MAIGEQACEHRAQGESAVRCDALKHWLRQIRIPDGG